MTYTLIRTTPSSRTLLERWDQRWSTQYLIESGTTGCDYIFWMDSDAIIMNMSFRLESLIHWDGMEDTDIVVAADTLAVNLAQSLWKFSRFSHQILEDSWNIGGVVPLVETGAFNAILGGCQPDHSPQEKVACYKHMDVGWKNRTFAREYFYPGNNRKIKENGGEQELGIFRLFPASPRFAASLSRRCWHFVEGRFNSRTSTPCRVFYALWIRAM